MSVLMVQSKIKAETVADVRAGIETVLAALDVAQSEGDPLGVQCPPRRRDFVVLLQVDDGVENPLPALPEYQEVLEIVKGSRAVPPSVQPLTVIGGCSAS